MNIKQLKIPRKMRVTSITSTKLKGMRMSRSFKNIKKINLKKRIPSLKKVTTGGGDGGAQGGGRMGIRRRSSKWISVVRKKILRPKFSVHKGSNKNIIIIHNNTSITGNEEDNRTSCATTVKEVVILKEEEDVTSVDSAAPPPLDQASKEEKTTTEDEEEEEESQGGSEIIRFKEEKAAHLIQSVFRGHLGRRAYRALRSLVKLQAVVRGVCVRRQARIALHCMNTMARLQVRVRERQLLNRPGDAC